MSGDFRPSQERGGLRGSPAVHVFITLKGEEPRLAIYDPYVKDSKSV